MSDRTFRYLSRKEHGNIILENHKEYGWETFSKGNRYG